MNKYLVVVPTICFSEVYVEANNEEEAKEKAYLDCVENKEHINEETVSPLYFDDTIEKTKSELIEFGISQGYQVYDCKKEFGDDF